MSDHTRTVPSWEAVTNDEGSSTWRMVEMLAVCAFHWNSFETRFVITRWTPGFILQALQVNMRSQAAHYP